jgi:3-oxoacyl-[acyl-carrier-protein] synthase-3
MKYAKIIGTGGYLPKNIVKNSDLEKTLNTTNEWIVKKTGIRQRHIADTKETSAFMATQAAQKALKKAGLNQVDMILVATTTPDAFFPNTACLVQAALGHPQCPAFDISAACAGFNYALSIADQFIRSGQYEHILVIGSDTLSRLVDWLDRTTCVLFGDGAGAVVLKASDTPGIIASHIYADGQHEKLLYANNMRAPDAGIIKMQGSFVLRQAVSKMGDALTQLLTEQNIPVTDIDWLIPHQSNLNIIQNFAKQLNLPQEKVILTISEHANTSSASVPLALNQAIEDGRIQPDQLLLLESFGGGITWGTSLVRY